MKRREFMTLLGGAATWPIAGRAQDRVRRIGALMPEPENYPESQARMTAFQQALAKLGWNVGRNLVIDYRCIVASLARPGGNATGFSNIEPSFGSKWLELLKEIAPHVRGLRPYSTRILHRLPFRWHAPWRPRRRISRCKRRPSMRADRPRLRLRSRSSQVHLRADSFYYRTQARRVTASLLSTWRPDIGYRQSMA
jgi:hypothetical protein